MPTTKKADTNNYCQKHLPPLPSPPLLPPVNNDFGDNIYYRIVSFIAGILVTLEKWDIKF